jgi:hypothetical protein
VIRVQMRAKHQMYIGRIATCAGKVLQPLGLQSMRPGNTALLVVAATGVDQHVEAIDVQQIAEYLDAEDRSLRIHRELIAAVPSLQRRQVFAGHARHGELHGHPALALANALDFKLAQVAPHEPSPACVSAILSWRESRE